MKSIQLIAAVTILVIFVFVGKLVTDAGAFRSPKNHFSGKCQEYTNVPGPEDMELEPKNGLLFISSDSRPQNHDETTPGGAIYILDTNLENAKPVRISAPDLGFTFHPHGISLFTENDVTTLFVVNHRKTEGSIEIFEWKDRALSHLRTIRSPLLLNIHNDVVAVSRTSFYVSQEQGSENPLIRNLESYSRIGRGNVTFYDGNQMSLKASGLSYANGMTISSDGKKLLVAEMLSLQVRVFERDLVTNNLKDSGAIALNSGPDNISFDSQGNLWVGAHINLFKLKAHSRDHSLKAPSQILKIVNPLSEKPVVTEVFVDSGEKISASSVAVVVGQRLFLGSIFENRFLECNSSAGEF